MLGFEMRTAKMAWTVFLVFFLIFVTYLIRETLFLVVYAIFFSYLIYPLVQFADQHTPKKISRNMSLIAVYLFAALIVGGLFALFGERIADEARKLSEQIPGLMKKNNLLDQIWLPSFLEPLRAKGIAYLHEHLDTQTDQALPFAERLGLVVMYALRHLLFFVLVPILSFLTIKEAPRMRVTILAMMDKAHRELWGKIIDDLDVLLAKYVKALLFLSFATLISYSLAFSLMGVPYAILLGASAALMEFIPFIGPLSAIVLIILVSVFSGFDHLTGLILFFGFYRIFQDYVLNPYLMSEGVEVSPFFVILGILAGEQIGGVPGIFISVPVMAAIKIVFLRLNHAKKGEA